MLAGSAELGGSIQRGGVGQHGGCGTEGEVRMVVEATTDEAELGVLGVQTCPYIQMSSMEETDIGGDHLAAKHGSEEGMWVDAAAQEVSSPLSTS